MGNTSDYIGWEIRYMVEGQRRDTCEIVYASNSTDAVNIIKDRYYGKTFRLGPNYTGTKIKSAYQIEQEQKQLLFQQKSKLEFEETVARNKAKEDARNKQYKEIRDEQYRIKNEQKKIEKEKILAEKIRIKSEKNRLRKIEALSKSLPENEKKDYDLQYEAFQKVKEQFQTQMDYVNFKTVIVPILFFSFFIFLYTMFNLFEQYHNGKLIHFSDIYSGSNNIIFLITLPLSIWGSISFQKYLLKSEEGKSVVEKVSNIIAFICLITTYILFRNNYILTYTILIGAISLSLFCISYLMYKKRLHNSLLAFEDEVIIQEDKYNKLIKKLNLV